MHRWPWRSCAGSFGQIGFPDAARLAEREGLARTGRIEKTGTLPRVCDKSADKTNNRQIRSRSAVVASGTSFTGAVKAIFAVAISRDRLEAIKPDGM